MSTPDLISLLTQKMSYLNQKQAVHAQNVANATTPGYKQLELAPFSFNDTLKQTQVSMATTDARHIIPASLSGANKATVRVKSYDTAPTGNSVGIEEEMTNVSKTNVEYQEITTLLKKFTGLFKIAIKGSST